MNCPNCSTDNVSFWRIWLLNFRQRIQCDNCDVELHIEMPGRIALGTCVLLVGSAAAYVSPAGSGLGLVLMLFAIVVNFLLTHHYVVLREEKPDNTID